MKSRAEKGEKGVSSMRKRGVGQIPKERAAAHFPAAAEDRRGKGEKGGGTSAHLLFLKSGDVVCLERGRGGSGLTLAWCRGWERGKRTCVPLLSENQERGS